MMKMRYWRNQYAAGVNVDPATYALFQGLAEREGKDVDQWFSDMVVAYERKVLADGS